MNIHFSRLFRAGDAPCMLFVYTVPGTVKPTITSCLPHHLQPEVVMRPDQRQMAYLDLIYDSVVQLLTSSSSSSDQVVIQIATTVATCVLILVLFMLKLRGLFRRKSTCANLPIPSKSSSAPSRRNSPSTKLKVSHTPPITAVSSTLTSTSPSTSRPRYKRSSANTVVGDIQAEFAVVRILPSPLEAMSDESVRATRMAIQSAVTDAILRNFPAPTTTSSPRSPRIPRRSVSRVSQSFGEVAATVHRSASSPDVSNGAVEDCDGNGNQKDKLFISTQEVRYC